MTIQITVTHNTDPYPRDIEVAEVFLGSARHAHIVHPGEHFTTHVYAGKEVHVRELPTSAVSGNLAAVMPLAATAAQLVKPDVVAP